MSLTYRINLFRFLLWGLSCFFLMAFTTTTAVAARVIPEQPVLSEMIEETLLDFAIAVKAEDFTVFYRRIFKTFMDKDIDLSGIKDLEPVFEKPPYLDNSGLLCVIGSYATKPSQAGFNLKYLTENDRWKLAGIRIKMK